MKHQRTSPPALSDDCISRPTTEEDVNRELIRRLRDEEDYGVEEGTSVKIQTTSATNAAGVSSVSVPGIISKVLNSTDRQELLAIAEMLDRTSAKEQFIKFVTPVGDIRCKICWMSCRPDELKGSENLFFVKIRTADASFIPKSGAVFDVGFSDSGPTFSVMCLAPPQPLYPGIDLMCFLPHNNPMEKNGKLKDGVPVEDLVSLELPVVEGTAASENFDVTRESI